MLSGGASRTVSCIVPVFNGERYLAEAVDSILAQTHRPIELIVVDDGSTDGSAAVASRYGDRVRLARQANAGPAAARNRGLDLATGDFVAFLDSDDLWHPDKLRLQLACFDRDPDLGGCVTQVRNFTSPELAVEAPDPALARDVPGYSTVTLLARRDVFDRVGPFDCRRAHSSETEWFLRCRARGVRVALLGQTLVSRRLHAANRSARLHARSVDEYLHLLKAHVDGIRNRAR
jgi:glycosyltransferase involved in cell wall biosynthesis